MSEPVHFRTAARFRAWLERRHASTDEIVIRFYRKDTGRGGMTYPEALDEALCFGWIDGIRRKHDDVSYTNRFTPRRARSNWSAVNLRHYERLRASGRVAPAGAAARNAWDGRAASYSFEHRETRLTPELAARFRRRRTAWRYFSEQPTWYRQTSVFWVMSARRDATRARRLAALVVHSERREWIPPLRRPTRVKKR